VCKEERISVARSNGKSAVANVLLKRAHNKNEGDTTVPLDLSQEDVLKARAWGTLQQIYRLGWRVEILGMFNY
jgi:hypothetical protein